MLWTYYRLDIVPGVGATKFSSIGMESFDRKMDYFIHTLFDVPGYGFDKILSESFFFSMMMYFCFINTFHFLAEYSIQQPTVLSFELCCKQSVGLDRSADIQQEYFDSE